MTSRVTRVAGNGWAGSNSSTIEEVAVGELVIDVNDPWKQQAEDIERAISFVKHFGRDHIVPVLVDGANNVITGTAIVEAARKAGVKILRVVRQVFPDDAERKLFSVASNRILSTGYWDGDALAKVVLEFEKSIEDFSHDLIAFPPGVLDKLIGGSISSGGTDEVPLTTSLKAVSSIGQVWLAGRHRVMCGDATEQIALATLMAGQLAAAACLDPPFGCPVDGFVSSKGKHREFVQASGEMGEAELLEFLPKTGRGAFRHRSAGRTGLPVHRLA